eukprot:477707-Pleurochrysis_carterae.AAC.3
MTVNTAAASTGMRAPLVRAVAWPANTLVVKGPSGVVEAGMRICEDVVTEVRAMQGLVDSALYVIKVSSKQSKLTHHQSSKVRTHSLKRAVCAF